MLRMKLKEHSIRTEKYFVFGMPAEVINSRVKEIRDIK
jgi:ornithine decarboxylase